jgi:two-component system cell cycle sensor histidine kinase/response regulator CckA
MATTSTSKDAAERKPAGRARAEARGRQLLLAAVLLATVGLLLAGISAGLDKAVVAAGVALAAVAGIALLSLSRTEHKAAMAQRQAGVLAHAVDALPGGAAVIDAGGTLVHANAVFASMLPLQGRRPAAALVEHLMGGAEAQQRFKRLSAAAAKGQAAKEQLPVKTAHGAQGWWEVSANPVPGLAGYSLWIVDDITAKREAEAIVAAEQAKAADFLENAPVGFYSVDANGRFTYVNRTLARWLETTPETLTTGRLRVQDLTRISQMNFSAGPYLHLF